MAHARACGGRNDREARQTHKGECGKGAGLGEALSRMGCIYRWKEVAPREGKMIEIKTREQGLGEAGRIVLRPTCVRRLAWHRRAASTSSGTGGQEEHSGHNSKVRG